MLNRFFSPSSFKVTNPIQQGMIELCRIELADLSMINNPDLNPEKVRASLLFAKLNRIGMQISQHCEKLAQDCYGNQDELLYSVRVALPYNITLYKFILQKLDEMDKVFCAMLPISSGEVKDLYAAIGKSIGIIYTAIKTLYANPADAKNCYHWLITVIERMDMKTSPYLVYQKYYATTREIFYSLTDNADLDSSDKAKLLVKAVLADYLQMRNRFMNSRTGSFEEYLNQYPDMNHMSRKLGLILELAIRHFPKDLPDNIRHEIKELKLSGLNNPYNDFMVGGQRRSNESFSPIDSMLAAMRRLSFS